MMPRGLSPAITCAVSISFAYKYALSGLIEDQATVAQYPFLCLREATVARFPPFCVLVRQPRPTSRSLVPTLVVILSTFRPTDIRPRRRTRDPDSRSVPQAFYRVYSTSSRT